MVWKVFLPVSKDNQRRDASITAVIVNSGDICQTLSVVVVRVGDTVMVRKNR